jgi:hypothetical protein
MTSDTSDDRRAVLDLFSGLGGFSAAFEDSPEWEVTTVDIKGRFAPDIQADVLNLRPDDLSDADLILASPPCNCFSKAAAWQEHWDDAGAPQTAAARESVALVFHTVGLIRAISPEYWVLENPEGHLRRFLGRPTGSVTYCQYGERYQKPTDLWGDHPPGMTYRRCATGDPCHLSKGRREEAGCGNHPAQAIPRDPAERAKVPYELSQAILNAVEGRGEQTTLTGASA